MAISKWLYLCISLNRPCTYAPIRMVCTKGLHCCMDEGFKGARGEVYEAREVPRDKVLAISSEEF
jgi:hypothetical protein